MAEVLEALDADHGEFDLRLLEIFEIQEFERLKDLLPAFHLRAASESGLWVSRGAWQARAPRSVSHDIRPSQLACHWEGPHMGIFPHSSCPTKVRGIQAFHMDVRKWADIAYSHVVCPHGYVFEARGAGVRTAANGTNLGNDHAYAVCFLGGIDDPFTNESKHAFHLAATNLGVEDFPWRPHNYYFNSACPGTEIDRWVRTGHPDPSESETPGVTMPGYSFVTSTTRHADWVEIDGVSWLLMSDGSIAGSPGSNALPSKVQGVNGQPYWTAATHHAGPDSATKLHIRKENGIYVSTIEDSEQKLFRPDGGPGFRTH